MPPIDLASLLVLERTGPDLFRSRISEANLSGVVFGGQYLGQALWAAMATQPGRPPHAMSAYFLREARADHPLDFVVERTRDGRAFSHRRVAIFQAGREVFRAEVSLHDPADDQVEHQRPAPMVASPETLVSYRTLAEANADRLDERTVALLTRNARFDIWPVQPHVGLTVVGDEACGRYWVKTTSATESSPELGYAGLAYLSDVMVNAPSRVMHSKSLFDGSLASLSLNHSIWFHRPPVTHDWLLFDLDSPSADGGLGSNRGLIYGRHGDLYASVVQDALITRAAAP